MKFGTSGLRGLVSEMTDPVCAGYVAAFLRYLRRTEGFGEVLVGRDLRPSSPRIAAACRAAVQADGAAAIDCGVLPTPALALEAARRGAPAVMVTGSHIPFDRNGLKFYRAAARSPSPTRRGSLGRARAALPRRPASAVEPGGASGTATLRAMWTSSGRAAAWTRVGSTSTARPVATSSSRSSGGWAPRRWRSGGPTASCRSTPRRSRRGRAADPGGVLERALDALVSTDGDGDRPLIADEAGAVLRGDTPAS